LRSAVITVVIANLWGNTTSEEDPPRSARNTYFIEALRTDSPFARGINSFQLYSDGTRWWIVTIFWDAETGNKPIPAKYLTR
jgi:hypothetical protein